MHSETLSSWAWACAEGRPESGPPPGISLPQERWADWKAGEAGLTPEPMLWIWTPPPLGSGNFGTPWERMQSANLIPCAAALEAEADLLAGLPEEPQAEIATPQPSATSTISRRLLAVGMLMSRFYPASGNTEVTACCHDASMDRGAGRHLLLSRTFIRRANLLGGKPRLAIGSRPTASS
jgi:hypothetical protein